MHTVTTVNIIMPLQKEVGSHEYQKFKMVAVEKQIIYHQGSLSLLDTKNNLLTEGPGVTRGGLPFILSQTGRVKEGERIVGKK